MKKKKTKKRVNRTSISKPRIPLQPIPPVHPWRVCPYGEHWVKTHPLHVPPGETDPAGFITTRHGHCARNPSGKDQLYPEEIQEIATRNFSDVKAKPCPLNLGYGEHGKVGSNIGTMY